MAATLKTLTLKGWKSIRDAEVSFGRVNVLIGANGSGKSNLVSFFKMLGEMSKERLGLFIGKNGGGAAHLFYGPKETATITAELDFEGDGADPKYAFQLAHAAPDRLIFQGESVLPDPRLPETRTNVLMGTGSPESAYLSGHFDPPREPNDLPNFIENCRTYQFHDTTASSGIRLPRYINDNQFLHSDGSNLAAMLLLYREKNPVAYQRIISAIQLTAPYFRDFVLSASPFNGRDISLDWKEVGSDINFGAHQLSDGTLRFIALATLLLQPNKTLPNLIVIDEPELGLHPHAIGTFVAMVRQASVHAQVILATQSPTLLDHFGPEDTIVANRTITQDGRKHYESTFHRLAESDLEDWLEDYSLSELWEKNIIGGSLY